MPFLVLGTEFEISGAPKREREDENFTLCALKEGLVVCVPVDVLFAVFIIIDITGVWEPGQSALFTYTSSDVNEPILHPGRFHFGASVPVGASASLVGEPSGIARHEPFVHLWSGP